jgi:hypothetical protein
MLSQVDFSCQLNPDKGTAQGDVGHLLCFFTLNCREVALSLGHLPSASFLRARSAPLCPASGSLVWADRPSLGHHVVLDHPIMASL